MSRRKWMTSKPPCLLKVQLQAAMTFSVLWKELETKVPVCFGTACYFGHVGENRYQRILRNKRKTFELQPKAWAGREGHLDSREQWKVGKHTMSVVQSKQDPWGWDRRQKWVLAIDCVPGKQAWLQFAHLWNQDLRQEGLHVLLVQGEAKTVIILELFSKVFSMDRNCRFPWIKNFFLLTFFLLQSLHK